MYLLALILRYHKDIIRYIFLDLRFERIYYLKHLGGIIRIRMCPVKWYILLYMKIIDRPFKCAPYLPVYEILYLKLFLFRQAYEECRKETL